jgi:hypothetical protein
MKFDVVMFLNNLCQAERLGGNAELPARIEDWPDGWREEFEERAAIMEYDGMLSRSEAEQWAETIVRATYRVNKGVV